MEDPYLQRGGHHPPPPHSGSERTAGFFIAVPFVVCFSLFGVLNLVGGTALTAMSCRPKMGPRALASLHRIVRNFRIDEHIDPMRVVGIMLLVTGSLLVVIGLALGVTACRSVGEHERKRRRRQLRTSSTLPLYSLTERRRTSASLTSSGASPSVNARCGKKRSLEKTVSPIMEEPSGEYESLECEELAVEVHRFSDASLRNASPRCEVLGHAEKSTDENVCQEMVPKDTTDTFTNILSPGVIAEVVCHASQSTEDVSQMDLAADSILHSKDAPCQEILPKDSSNIAVRDSSPNASTDADYHSSQTTEGVYQTETPDNIFQLSHFIGEESIFNTSLSTWNNREAEDSNHQVGPSTNSAIPVDSMGQYFSKPKLDVSRSRIRCNGEDMIPNASSSHAERTVVDIKHGSVNYSATDNTDNQA